jgi:hypothetical protein
MTRNIFFSIVIIFSVNFRGNTQNIQQIDSISYRFCEFIENMPEMENDTLKFEVFVKRALEPFIHSLDPENAEKIFDQLFFRLQRNCIAFTDLLDVIQPPAERGDRTLEKPLTKLSAKELAKFKKRSKFYYKEASGEITKLTMKNGKWKDKFVDGTYSLLSYEWISDYEFVLTFKESNNVTRANFSVPGDQLVYGVVEKHSDHYLMFILLPGKNPVYEYFKLYF